MNLQAGTTVGFTTAVGALGGAVFGGIMAALLDVKQPGAVMVGLAATGGLVGAFMGGVIVGPDTSTTSTNATGSGAVPRVAQRVAQPNQLTR